MPTRRKRSGAPTCRRGRPRTGRACGRILTCRFERCCAGSVGAFCILAACLGGDATWALVSAYGTVLLFLAVGGPSLW